MVKKRVWLLVVCCECKNTNYLTQLPNSLPYLNPTTVVAVIGLAVKSVAKFFSS
jgi:hypothetical protein